MSTNTPHATRLEFVDAQRGLAVLLMLWMHTADGWLQPELKAGAEQYHYGTLVDMTPCEVGRHPELMQRVAQKTGVNVIAVTGFFPERMGIPYWFRRQTVEELADFYIRDLTEGMVFAGTKTNIKAGAIKIATVWFNALSSLF